jgi:DNA primase
MSEVLEKTRPLIDVLWERELNAQPTTTPEQRAALEARLGALTNSIQDAAVRNHYARELRDRLYQLGRQRSPMRGGAVSAGRFDGGKGQGSYARPVAPPDWRQRDRTRLGGASSERRFASRRDVVSTLPLASPELTSHFQSISPREALIMKTLLNHPWLIDEYSEAIAAIEFAAPALSVLRDEILGVHARQNSLDSATLRTQLSKSGVAKVVDLVAQTITHASDRFAEPDASAADVEAAWHHILALHQRQAALGVALKAAEEAWYRDCTEEAEMRLLDIKRQIAREAAMDQMDEEFEQPDDDASEVKRAV